MRSGQYKLFIFFFVDIFWFCLYNECGKVKKPTALVVAKNQKGCFIVKKFLCIFLVIVSVMSACVISAGAKSGPNYQRDKCVSSLSYPNIISAELHTDNSLTVKWENCKNSYQYKIYIRLSGMNNWECIKTVKALDSRGNSFSTRAYYNPTNIFDKYKIGAPSAYDSNSRVYYYPTRVTVRGFDKNGKAITKFQTDAYFKHWYCDDFTPAALGCKSASKTSFRHIYYVSKPSCVGNNACYIRLYYKSGSSWKKMGADTFMASNTATEYIPVTIPKNWSSYTLAARAIDSKGRFMSGYRVIAQGKRYTNIWNFWVV